MLLLNAKMLLLNAKMLLLNAKMLLLNAKMLLLNAKMLLLNVLVQCKCGLSDELTVRVSSRYSCRFQCLSYSEETINILAIYF